MVIAVFGLPTYKKRKSAFVSAIIVAAGAGSRMGGVDKQQIMLLDGVPIVARSIQQFQDCPRIAEIVVVCREEEIANFYHILRDFGLDKVVSVVAGGAQRQNSVFAGIAACSEEADFFAIHDGARPLILPEQIENCLSAAMEYGAAAVGVPVKDTIKIETPDHFIKATPDRGSLKAIQTPQIFAAKLYREAMGQAKAAGRFYTDDCQLVEHAGGKVYIAEGSYENIKITTPEDIAHANAILAYREGGLGLFDFPYT
jgi:2-C-methyl-D-erythritol 4-phosphate cytidylyltransferase